jgi:hypothetical protein
LSEGLRWSSAVTLYHVISTARQSAFAYQVFLNGSTDSGEPLSDYGAGVAYRQSVWRPWLVIELRTGVDWPRYAPTEERRANYNVGLAFEMSYGNHYGDK